MDKFWGFIGTFAAALCMIILLSSAFSREMNEADLLRFCMRHNIALEECHIKQNEK